MPGGSPVNYKDILFDIQHKFVLSKETNGLKYNSRRLNLKRNENLFL